MRYPLILALCLGRGLLFTPPVSAIALPPLTRARDTGRANEPLRRVRRDSFEAADSDAGGAKATKRHHRGYFAVGIGAVGLALLALVSTFHSAGAPQASRSDEMTYPLLLRVDV